MECVPFSLLSPTQVLTLWILAAPSPRGGLNFSRIQKFPQRKQLCSIVPSPFCFVDPPRGVVPPFLRVSIGKSIHSFGCRLRKGELRRARERRAITRTRRALTPFLPPPPNTSPTSSERGSACLYLVDYSAASASSPTASAPAASHLSSPPPACSRGSLTASPSAAIFTFPLFSPPLARALHLTASQTTALASAGVLGEWRIDDGGGVPSLSSPPEPRRRVHECSGVGLGLR